MTRPGRLSAAFGIVMVVPLAVEVHGPALASVIVAAAALVVGGRVRSAATLGVLAVVVAIALSDVPPLTATLSGLAAAAYLVTRHAAGLPGLVTTTQPTMVGAVGFTIAGLAATAFPLRLPWLPLLAPLAVMVIYVLVTRPFWAGRD